MCSKSMMALFVLDAMSVNTDFQSALSNDIVALTPGVMVSGVISYHGRSNMLRIEGNLNSNRIKLNF
ncbi:UNVERIFIED_CONTAM: hypothetical protein NCL1_42037 [Trichonephila clavipes]